MTRKIKLRPDQAAMRRVTAQAVLETFDQMNEGAGRLPFTEDTRRAMALFAAGAYNTLTDAAEAAGLNANGFRRTAATDKGRATIQQMRDILLTRAGQAAILNIADLAQQDKSLSVAMRANEWLAGVNGITPSNRVDIHHSGAVQFFGLTISIPQLPAPDMQSDVINGQAVEIKGIPG